MDLEAYPFQSREISSIKHPIVAKFTTRTKTEQWAYRCSGKTHKGYCVTDAAGESTQDRL
jgi:hypothetical protein